MFDAVTEARELLALIQRAGLLEQKNVFADATAGELMFRSAHILAVAAIGKSREEYNVALQALMHEPEPASQGEDDALIDVSDFLGVIDVIDLLSDIDLHCIAPRLHRGWQDRRQSCKRARRVSEEIFGFSLTAKERRILLSGWGVCHRIFRIPPPVDPDTASLEELYSPLLELIVRLAPSEHRAAFERVTAEISGPGKS